MRRVFILMVALLTISALAAPAGANAKVGGSQAKLKKTKGYEKTVQAAIVDIQRFWSDEFPAVYDEEYEPIPKRRIFAAHPGIKLPLCQGQKLRYKDAQNNAFYCFEDNYVAYDDVELFPKLYNEFGTFSIALVLAHEWGHAIQDRAENDDQPTIYLELQADCFAGAWTSRVDQGDAKGVDLEGGELDAALAAMLSFRDPVGFSADEAGAHGSGFDRISAFQDGYENGTDGCAGYFDTPPVVTEIPFSSQEDFANEGNLDADLVIPSTVDLLNDFYSQVASDVYQPLTIDDIVPFDSSSSKLPKCGGTALSRKTVTNRVFYCIDDGYIGFDEPYVQSVYDNIGDFGVTTLFANTFATYVQLLQNFPGADDNEDNAVLGADCYTGGFAAAMYRGVLLIQPDRKPKYALSPGDLDETIQTVIDYNQARGISSTADATFLRVKTFKGGFLNGYQSCSSFANA